MQQCATFRAHHVSWLLSCTRTPTQNRRFIDISQSQCNTDPLAVSFGARQSSFGEATTHLRLRTALHQQFFGRCALSAWSIGCASHGVHLSSPMMSLSRSKFFSAFVLWISFQAFGQLAVLIPAVKWEIETICDGRARARVRHVGTEALQLLVLSSSGHTEVSSKY